MTAVPPGGSRPPPAAPSAFAPLANRAFLGLWVANLLHNIGGWMQTTGAAWEMTSLTAEPIFVALLSAAGTLPMFLFCFLSGVLADRFDRRRYLIGCQLWMMAVAGALAALAYFGWLTPWNLLLLTFCMGIGNAMNAPAWHAVVPEIVTGHQLRQAIALNSAGFNIARTIAPVIGQILLSAVGVFLLFAINSLTFVFVILALLAWRLSAEARASQRREGYLEAAGAGIAFVRGSAELRAIFARGICFFVPGIAMGTLLPVIGRFELGLDEFDFGILYGIFGVGAVGAAMAMPLVNRLLGADRANIWAMAVSAIATLAAALAMTPLLVGLVVAINGACWITVIANNGAAVQMILPNYMRARGMAVHQMVFFGAMVVGSLIWGNVADWFGVRVALAASALALAPMTLLAATIRLPGSASSPRV